MRRIVVVAVGEVEDDEDIAQIQARIEDVVGVDAVAVVPGSGARARPRGGHAG